MDRQSSMVYLCVRACAISEEFNDYSPLAWSNVIFRGFNMNITSN